MSEGTSAMNVETSTPERPRPSWQAQMVTTIKLFASVGAIGLVLWLLDRVVTG
jgi:hypothetical protein